MENKNQYKEGNLLNLNLPDYQISTSPKVGFSTPKKHNFQIHNKLFSKFPNNTFSFKKFRWPLFIIILFLVLIAIITVINQISDRSAKASLISNYSSLSFGDGTISLSKVYVQNEVENATAEIEKSQPLTVRLKYDNTSSIAAKGVVLQDTIPAGFSLVSGSIRNCYVDSTCVNLNDNLYTNSSKTLKVAPGAGYFGYLNDNTLTSSNLEPGKFKSLHLHQCSFKSSTSDLDNFISVIDSYTNARYRAGTKVNNLDTDTISCGTLNSGYTNDNSYRSVNTFNLTGKRYLNLTQCVYWNSNTDFMTTLVGNYSATDSKSGSVTSNQIINLSCGTPANGYTLDTTLSANKEIDLLDQRYLYLNQCYYTARSGKDIFTSFLSNFSNVNFRAGTTSSNNPSVSTSCGTPNSSFRDTAANSGIKKFDLLDRSRGYGYIEYQIQADSNLVPGLFGAGANMSGDMGSLIVGSDNSITVNQYLSKGDIPSLTGSCNGGQIVLTNSTTNCTFYLPQFRLFPEEKVYASIGQNSSVLCLNGGRTQFSCMNVSVGASPGSFYLSLEIIDSGKDKTSIIQGVSSDIKLENGYIPYLPTTSESPIKIDGEQKSILGNVAIYNRAGNKFINSGTPCTNLVKTNLEKTVAIPAKIDTTGKCSSSLDPSLVNSDSILDITTVVNLDGADFTSQTYRVQVVKSINSEGLKLWYDFNHPANTMENKVGLYDLSENNAVGNLGLNNEVDNSDPSLLNENKENFNQSYTFDGKDDFIQTGIPSNSTDSLTAEIWFKRSTPEPTESQFLSQRLFTIYASDNTSRLSLGIEGETIRALAGNDLPTLYNTQYVAGEQWQMASLTYDSNTEIGQIYVNSVKYAEFKQPLLKGGKKNISLGIYDESLKDTQKSAFEGHISIFRLYDRQLSDKEISANFQNEKINFGYTANTIQTSLDASFTFDPVGVDDKSLTTESDTKTLVISDRRSSGSASWSVDVLSTDFSGNCKLQANNLSIIPVGLTLISGNMQSIRIGNKATFTDSRTSLNLARSNGDTTGGIYYLNFKLSLTIPPYTRSGGCQNTLTLSVS